jgi:hypothetical protein
MTGAGPPSRLSTADRRRPAAAAPLTVRAAGFLPLRGEPAVPGGDVEIEVALEASELVALAVVDADTGAPVQGARAVHQWDHLGRGRVNKFEEVRFTDAAGMVRLPVQRGASRIEAAIHHPRYAYGGAVLGQEELERAGGGESIPVKLVQGFPVEGVVLDEKDEPVPYATVNLDPIGRADYTDWIRFACLQHFGQAPDAAPTDAEGTFVLPVVEPGEYLVRATHRHYYADPANPTVLVGPQGGVWIGTLKSGASLEGLIAREDGTGIAGASIMLMKEEPDDGRSRSLVKTALSREDGSFEVRGLPEGRYQAVFSAGKEYTKRREEIDTADPPPRPWRIVLRREEHGAGAGPARKGH